MIRIWGHRGCRGEHNPPENSLPAFQAAIDQGADGVELDVFLTNDNQLVVFHDDTLDRMTNGHGNITDYTLSDLKKLRLKNTAGQLTEEQIPTLDEVLNLIGKRSHFTINIEIKAMKGNMVGAVGEAIGKRLEAAWTINNFQISSFEMDSLRAMRKVRPEVPLGALFTTKNTSLRFSKHLESIRDIQPQTVNIPLNALTHKAARLIRESGAAILAWSSGEPNPATLSPSQRHTLARHLAECGVHILITDYPREIRILIDRASAN